MRPKEAGLSAEAIAALRAERRSGFRRSMAISMGFSLIVGIAFSADTPVYVTTLIFGLPMGLAMSWLHLDLIERLRHRSFLVTILRQSLAYIAVLAICNFFSLYVQLVVQITAKGGTLQRATEIWLGVVAAPWFLGAIPAGLLLVLPIRFMFQLTRKLGPGTLTKWMRGYYHEPREEERIFMFLDMKDSTALAERLGNLKFSALVRDFFQDLTLPVMQTRAEVSHYIGDEAVLTWTLEAGIERANCVRLFFEFEKAIARRAPYYQAAYGLTPGFKAGAHLGRVVSTEVGEVKSEIVYHGDVLNTAARIQGLCNETGEGLLLSKALAERLTLPASLQEADLGQRELKGKAEAVGLVAIRLGSHVS